jgi:glycosyltransferase involved in cell wall biosynthesis
VSVVLPAYEAAATIAGAVASVLRQTESDFELIVVDDGSADGTAEVVERFEDPRVRIVRRENRGAAAARNTGVNTAAAPLVAFIDSDDLWLPGFLAGMREIFEREPATALAYTDAWVVDAETRRVSTSTAMQWQHPPIPPPADPTAFLLELVERNFVYTATVARRSVLVRLGGFDERLRAAIDYDMWLRIVAANESVGWLPGLNAVYRRDRPGSISSDKARMFRALATVYTRLADDPEAPAPARERARARAAAALRELAAAEGGRDPASLWRARVRPRMVALRNAVGGHERWLDAPPAEVADVLRLL